VDVVVLGSDEVDGLRSVSERPGAEGAPRSVGLDVVVGCEVGGTIRRDCCSERLVGWVGR
jgi:hypothetical protein